jgi:hypothetical protein
LDCAEYKPSLYFPQNRYDDLIFVGTHQHNDHLSGFVHAAEIFRKIGMNEVWLSWLDEPGNKNAERIVEGHKALVGAVVAIDVYVLGPPLDANLLFDINPGKSESYDLKLAENLNLAEGFLSALTNFTGDKLEDEPYFPFAFAYENKFEEASEFLSNSYLKDDNAWRRIDGDWTNKQKG